MAPFTSFLLIAIPFTTLANINFTWVQPRCSPSDTYDHCLKGQTCNGTTCIADYALPVMIHQAAEKRSFSWLKTHGKTTKQTKSLPHKRQVVRSDKRCGPDFGDSQCATGSCCLDSGLASVGRPLFLRY